MLDQTDELAQGLRTLADSAPPTADGGIDIPRAVRAGRVRLQRRRFAACGAVVAVVAAIAVVASLPAGPARSSKPAPAATRTAEAPLPDPLVVDATYGWLPENFKGVEYMPEQKNVLVRADGTIPKGGSNAPMIYLRTYPPGTTPPLGKPFYPGGPRQYRVDAPPVNGRTAYWVGKSPTAPWGPAGSWTLRWQGADGQWAEMTTDYMPEIETKQILHQIAEKVVVARQAIPLPYRISGLPAGLKPYEAGFQRGGLQGQVKRAPWSTSVTFVVNGKSINTVIEPVDPKPAKGSAGTAKSPSSGAVQHLPYDQTCLQAHGLSICTRSTYGYDAYRSIGGPTAWLKKFTLLGPDQKTWTTDVLTGR